MSTDNKILETEISILSGKLEMLKSDFKEIADALGCDVKDSEAMLNKIALLQGAAGKSPAIQNGWVACSERMPGVREPVYIFHPDYGVDQCAWYDDKEDVFTWDDEFRFRTLESVSHWMAMPALPAAPQQEVKS